MLWQPQTVGAAGAGRARKIPEAPGREDFNMDGVGLGALTRGSWPWLLPGKGGLGLGRQAVLVVLYTFTGLLGAWFLPGEKGSWTRGVRRCWPPCTRSLDYWGLVLARQRGSWTRGVRRYWPPCTRSSDYWGPGSCQAKGGLGLGASGGVGRLVHVHRITGGLVLARRRGVLD